MPETRDQEVTGEAFIRYWLGICRWINSSKHREFGGGTKGERRSVTSQAPPLLRQRKPYLTGSPPSRRERRCRQEGRGSVSISRDRGDVRTNGSGNFGVWQATKPKPPRLKRKHAASAAILKSPDAIPG